MHRHTPGSPMHVRQLHASSAVQRSASMRTGSQTLTQDDMLITRKTITQGCRAHTFGQDGRENRQSCQTPISARQPLPFPTISPRQPTKLQANHSTLQIRVIGLARCSQPLSPRSSALHTLPTSSLPSTPRSTDAPNFPGTRRALDSRWGQNPSLVVSCMSVPAC
jgi:hypothetical protein